MKLFLFGGADAKLGEVPKELKLVEQVIRDSGARQVLHIPFARPVANEVEWEGDWYHRYIQLDTVEYLNASYGDDIARATKPLIFISGGLESGALLKKIQTDTVLLKLVKDADTIIGESGGAKILGAYARVRNERGEREIVKGLGLLANAVIEPHYSQEKRQAILESTMREAGVAYGVGIDAMTAIVLETEKFPEKYGVIGVGKVVVNKL